MAKTYRPMGDRILVRRDVIASVTGSGLFIPDTVVQNTKLFEGTVAAIGEDDVIKVKVGDKVLFDSHVGEPLQQDGLEHVMIQFRDILAVIEHS